MRRAIADASPRAEGTPASASGGVPHTYEQYFGLAEPPFSRAPDMRFAFNSESHVAALDAVRHAIGRRESLTTITGDPGTGKTLLCQAVVEHVGLAVPRAFVSLVGRPPRSAEDVLRHLLLDFGLITRDEADAYVGTKQELAVALQRFVASLVSLRSRAIVVVDDAHAAGPAVLEQLCGLWMLAAGSPGAVHVVLVGQPSLDGLLARSVPQRARQHLSHRHQLQPLRPAEVGRYVERRLWVAHGGVRLVTVDRRRPRRSRHRFWRVRFSRAALRSVAQVSRGVPRTINAICDRSLEAAHDAGQRTIDASRVLKAAQQLHLDVPTSAWIRSRWPSAAASVALIAAAAWQVANLVAPMAAGSVASVARVETRAPSTVATAPPTPRRFVPDVATPERVMTNVPAPSEQTDDRDAVASSSPEPSAADFRASLQPLWPDFEAVANALGSWSTGSGVPDDLLGSVTTLVWNLRALRPPVGVAPALEELCRALDGLAGVQADPSVAPRDEAGELAAVHRAQHAMEGFLRAELTLGATTASAPRPTKSARPRVTHW